MKKSIEEKDRLLAQRELIEKEKSTSEKAH